MKIGKLLLYHGSDQKVVTSETYKSLLDKPYLQEEGSLFICELLERELQAK